MNEEIKTSEEKGKIINKLIIIVIILLIVVFGGWYGLNKVNAPVDTDTTINSDLASVIAVVNGAEILRTEFDKLLAVQKAVLGEPQDSEQEKVLQDQVLDIIISQTLLLQKANELGLSVADDKIDLQVSRAKAQFADEKAFTDALSEQGVTEQGFRDSINRDLLIQNYINSQVNLESVVVTDEEVKASYDLASTKQDNLPDLETLSESIKAQLTQQKQQQLVLQLIENLKNESNIEILLK